MTHATLEKFGYPATLIREYKHWSVLLRPKQATLGALVLTCNEDATAFSDISPAAATEMPAAVKDIETTLKARFAYSKINYLMLMMVDPQVHFHVLPRYETPQTFEDINFTDPGFPGPPDLSHANEAPPETFEKLLEDLRRLWPTTTKKH